MCNVTKTKWNVAELAIEVRGKNSTCRHSSHDAFRVAVEDVPDVAGAERESFTGLLDGQNDSKFDFPATELIVPGANGD